MLQERDGLSSHDREMAALTEHSQQMLRDGASTAEILAYLHHAREATSGPWPNPIDAIMVLMSVYGMHLPEALRIVQEDPTWREEAESIQS